jgi:hypothetical protein
MASTLLVNTISPYTGSTITVTPTSVTWSGNPTHSGTHTWTGIHKGPDGTVSAPTYGFASNPTSGYYCTASGRPIVAVLSNARFGVGGGGAIVGADGAFQWTTTDATGTADTFLVRDAANTVAQRNGTNAQAFRLYNTFTTVSDYERLQLDYSANIARVITTQAGTGVARQMQIGTTGANSLQFITNGAGTYQIQSSGHLVAVTDNTLDIGAVGANRPRTIYAGTSLIAPTATLATNISVGGDSITGVASQSDVNAMTSTTEVLTPNHNQIILGTPVASTSGTTIDFTGIPAGVRRITVMFVGISTNGASSWGIQLGDSGGIETSGYSGSASVTNMSSNFVTAVGGASNIVHGSAILTLANSSTNTWVCQGTIGLSDSASAWSMGGSKSLTGVLDRIRLNTNNGTDTFDAGEVNISYER